MADENDDYIDQGGTRRDLKVEVQAAFVAQPAALTSSAPAAIASTAPSASYVQAEAVAVRNDVVALRATLAAVQADVAALRSTQAALLTALKASDNNGPMATS